MTSNTLVSTVTVIRVNVSFLIYCAYLPNVSLD